MQSFILVNGRSPRPQSFCTFCCELIQDSYVRFRKSREGIMTRSTIFTIHSSRDDENYEAHRISPGCRGRQGSAISMNWDGGCASRTG